MKEQLSTLATGKFAERIRLILPYCLAIAATGCLWFYNTGEVTTKESIRVVKEVEIKEVIKYVEVQRKDTRRVEITKPDGTKIVSTHDTDIGRKESAVSVEKKAVAITEERKEVREVKSLHRYNLGITLDADKHIGVSAGVRLGDLPIFLQAGFVPRTLYGNVGLSIQF